MSAISRRTLALASRTLAVLAVAAALRVEAAEPPARGEPVARPAAAVARVAPRAEAPSAAAAPSVDGTGKQAAALHACSQRADLLFVRKCVQACMIDSKTRTRVLQDSFDRDTCQQRCGHQRELPSFVDACMRRAGFAGAPGRS